MWPPLDLWACERRGRLRGVSYGLPCANYRGGADRLAYLIQWASAYAELGFDVPTVLAACAYVIVAEMVSVFERTCAC